MKGVWLMTFRYLVNNKIKTSIMVTCLTITIVLPLALHIMIDHYQKKLVARAEVTPLVVGAKGNRYDLVMKSLYFTKHGPEMIAMDAVDSINESSRANAIPLHASFSAKKHPVVGISFDYFEFRGLKTETGRLPARLGQAVLGQDVALRTGLGPGDTILTDQTNFYNLAATYPLKLHITGVLEASDSPDDRAIFVDIKTAWVIDGIGHGHTDLVKTKDSSLILKKNAKQVVASAAVNQYQEITDENIDGFHFHGDSAKFPITAVIVLPSSQKSATILKGRYDQSPNRQMVVPREVVAELMGIVFEIKKFFNANFVLVGFGTFLFIILVVMLSLRIRKREMQTLFRIGCSRMIVLQLQVCELSLILMMSVTISTLIIVTLSKFAPDLVKML